MVIVFTISHGQSQIERGFSINKEFTIENLLNKSLCAQQLVYDALKCSKKNVHDFEITAKMVTSCKTARSRYVMALEEAKNSRENEASNNKRKVITSEIDNVKRKRIEVDACIKSMTTDMNDCLDKGETNHDMAMLLKANAFRKSISEKKATMHDLDDAIKNLEEDLKKK